MREISSKECKMSHGLGEPGEERTPGGWTRKASQRELSPDGL